MLYAINAVVGTAALFITIYAVLYGLFKSSMPLWLNIAIMCVGLFLTCVIATPYTGKPL